MVAPKTRCRCSKDSAIKEFCFPFLQRERDIDSCQCGSQQVRDPNVESLQWRLPGVPALQVATKSHSRSGVRTGNHWATQGRRTGTSQPSIAIHSPRRRALSQSRRSCPNVSAEAPLVTGARLHRRQSFISPSPPIRLGTSLVFRPSRPPPPFFAPFDSRSRPDRFTRSKRSTAQPETRRLTR